jgi:hypothetical protein
MLLLSHQRISDRRYLVKRNCIMRPPVLIARGRVETRFTTVTESRPELYSETGRRPASVLRVHPQPEDQQRHVHQLFVEVPGKIPD